MVLADTTNTAPPLTSSTQKMASSPAVQAAHYFSTQTSDSFIAAKALLASNDMEGCMSLVEGMIKSTLEAHGNDELSPALGPLYYLYGTTLLYTVEDSTDAISMMSPEDQEEARTAVEEDKEIAWQNLDTARNLCEKIIAEGKADGDMAKSLNLDLAMIHVRLADCSKQNGRYRDSLGDYATALQLRIACLGPYSQKVADTRYSMAGACTSLAAGEEELIVDGVEETRPLTEEEKDKYKRESVKYYLDCGISFAGMAADQAKCDPTFKAILDDDDDDDDDDAPVRTLNTPADKLKAIRDCIKTMPLFKPYPPKPPADATDDVKAAWEEEKRKLESTWTDDESEFMFCFEMVDEMIECCEAADENLKVLNQVAENKREGEAAGDEGGGLEDGTTIGFGNASDNASLPTPPLATATTTTTATVTTTTAATTTTTATPNPAPMMVVKKKKKVAPTLVSTDAPAAKKAKVEVEEK